MGPGLWVVICKDTEKARIGPFLRPMGEIQIHNNGPIQRIKLNLIQRIKPLLIQMIESDLIRMIKHNQIQMMEPGIIHMIKHNLI